MESDTFYHYYNRANNRENLFREESNYIYFLHLLKKHIAPVAHVYSYCLLPNHFHLIIKTKETAELPEEIQSGKRKISQSFSNLFNAYAKGYNQRYERRGSLFQKHPKHKEVTTTQYLQQLILYINTNSAHHNLADYDRYPYSSYSILITSDRTNLKRTEVLDLFDGLENFEEALKNKNQLIELNQSLLLDED
jgi:putative transposase